MNRQPLKRLSAPPRQEGIALLMVLLVVAIVSLIATELSSRIQFDIQRAHNRQQYQQSYWYALGAERLARGLLEIASNDPTIHLEQAWANAFLTYPIDGGGMSIQISDRQNCFNINALAALNTPETQQTQPAIAQRQLNQLMVELEADQQQIPQLLEPLLDWLDSDTLPTGFQGVEDLHYSALNPAYLPANGPLNDLSELNLIDGFRPNQESDIEFIERLKPYLCVLPTEALTININTLPVEQAPLLSALSEGKITTADIQAALETRPTDGYADIDSFWNELPQPATGEPPLDETLKAHLAVSSEFFLARIQVRHYDANLILFSRIKRNSNSATTYQRRYGGPNE